MAGRRDLEMLVGDGETLIRDGYRGARILLRTGTRMLPASDPITRGVSRLVRKVDDTVTLAETFALSMLRPNAAPEDPAQRLGAFAAVAENEATFARSFAEVHYVLIETILRHLGAETVYISEQLIRLAFRTLLSRHADLVARMRSERPLSGALITEFAVAAALALIEWHPVRYVTAAEGGALHAIAEEDCNRACFLAAALAASAYASNWEEGADPADYLTSATEIVEARFSRFAALSSGAKPLDALIAEFNSLIPAMP